MMVLLVTGGAGFIGSHLCEKLLNEGFDVRIMDNFVTGKESNIESFKDQLEIVKGSITDGEIVKSSLKDVEKVYHVAAQASVAVSVKDPVLDATTNIIGTINLLEESIRKDVESFVFVSSGGAVYGNATVIPTPESAPREPVSPYGASKAAGELYVEYHARVNGLKYMIVRPGNIYGPRQDPHGEAGVISIFLEAIKRGVALHVFGDGKNTRDYLYVKDLVDLLYLSSENPKNTAINAGTGKETSVLDLVSLMREVTGKNPTVIHDPPRPGDARRSCLDITKAQEMLGWKPKIDLKEGIHLTWEWIRQ